MPSHSEHDDIKQLKKITWKSNLTRRIEEFREIINNGNNFEEHFGKEYLEKLTEKSARLNSFVIKLIIAYSLVMVALYSSQNLKDVEVRILGYSFKNVGYYKEFILFIAALISPISTIATAYRKYIDALINECIAKLVPDDNIRAFYKHIWVDSPLDALIKKMNRVERVTHHGFSVFLAATIGLVFSLFLVSLVLASFFIQIVVVYDVIANPTNSAYLNTFVVAFVFLSISFSWLAAIIQMPMPEIDYSNLYKIKSLEKDDPEKYKR